MSNGGDKDAENRFWRLHATVGKLILDGRRVPDEVANIYQRHIIDPPVVESVEKFALLVDLGIITVPNDYVHMCQLATFEERNRERFYHYDDDISDMNFPNPSRILHPGDKLYVRVFQQVVGGTSTSEEHMTFLATQMAIHTGAQGASLVFEQKRDHMPKGKWYMSFDEKKHLWAVSAGCHMMSEMSVDLERAFSWNLSHFESLWDNDYVFFCFTEVED